MTTTERLREALANSRNSHDSDVEAWGALEQAVEALLAELEKAEPVAASPLDASMPPRIWLQVDTEADNDERDEPVPESAWGDLTWHHEQIGGLEVEYVRADLAHPAPSVSAEDVDRIDCVLSELDNSLTSKADREAWQRIKAALGVAK